MDTALRVLIVEDSEDDTQMVLRELRQHVRDDVADDLFLVVQRNDHPSVVHA